MKIYLILEMSSINCIWLLTFFGTFGAVCKASRVELYEDVNYKRFVGEIDINGADEDDCYEVPDPQGNKGIRSIKTDKCLMMYTNKNCKLEHESRPQFNYLGISFRVDKNTADLKDTTDLVDPQHIASFALCSRSNDGGPEVDVDWYSKGQMQGPYAQRYKDLCGCRNLPISYKAGKSREVSVNNHGHRLQVFADEHCTGDNRTIPAGKNSFSFFIWPAQFTQVFDIRSFRPVGLLPCMKLSADIHKFRFTGTTGVEAIEDDLKVAKEDSAINDSDGKTTKRYTVSERVTETLQYTVAKSWQTMNSVGVSGSYEVEGGAGIPAIASGKMRARLAADYKWQRTDGDTQTESKTSVNDINISGEDMLEIPPCRKCRISSYIRTLTKPIQYTAFGYIKGMAGEDKMSASEIRAYLPNGVTYIRDVDEFTVEVTVEDSLRAKYGTSAYTDISCDPIMTCITRFGLTNPGPSNFTQDLPVSRTDA